MTSKVRELDILKVDLVLLLFSGGGGSSNGSSSNGSDVISTMTRW